VLKDLAGFKSFIFSSSERRAMASRATHRDLLRQHAEQDHRARAVGMRQCRDHMTLGADEIHMGRWPISPH